MGSRFRGGHFGGCSLLMGSLSLAGSFCIGCTTTLDPTTLESLPEDSAEPEPDEPVNTGCPGADGLGGATFSSCADLPPCTSVGEQEAHLICTHMLTYDAASYECQLRGGYLAEVNSEAENNLVAAAAGKIVKTNVWLGARRSETFVWAWENSQIVFWQGERSGMPENGMFVPWQPGEPNNVSTVSDEPEKCLALTMVDLDWNDRACSIKLPFVCEMD